MMLNKQIRLYLLVLSEHERWFCPAQSAEHVKFFLTTEEAASAEIYYLGWTGMERTEQGYQVVNFQAQENSDQVTGTEICQYLYEEKNRPQLVKPILQFLENYYREERLDHLENAFNALKGELAELQKRFFMTGEK